MATPSQNERLLHHLKQHGSITPRTAYVELGIYRLSARIFELRQQGHKITTHQKETGTRRFAEYQFYLS